MKCWTYLVDLEKLWEEESLGNYGRHLEGRLAQGDGFIPVLVYS